MFCFLESNSLELNSCKKQTILYRKNFLTAIGLGFKTSELLDSTKIQYKKQTKNEELEKLRT